MNNPPKLPPDRISIYNFTALWVLYTFLSAIVHLLLGSTTRNYQGYVFVIFPIHMIFSIVFLVGCLSRSPRRTYVHFIPAQLGQIFIAQGLLLFLTPAECTTGKQGDRCYALIQTLTQNTAKIPVDRVLEMAFPIALVIYLLITVWFFKNTQIKRAKTSPSAPIT
jgi:hypothetical protein